MGALSPSENIDHVYLGHQEILMVIEKWVRYIEISIFSSTVTTEDLIHMQSSLDFHLLTCPSVN